MAREKFNPEVTSEAPLENLFLKAANAYLDGKGLEGEERKYPSMRAIAEAVGGNQQRVYTIAKQPIAGQPYDPDVINWDAIERFVTKRLNPDEGIGTYDEVIAKAYDFDANKKAHDRRRGVSGGNAAEMITLPDGSTTPKRRMELTQGQRVMLRTDKEGIVYNVVLLSDTDIVLQREGWPSLKSLGNWTTNQKILTDESIFDKLIADRTAVMEAAKAAAEPTTEAVSE